MPSHDLTVDLEALLQPVCPDQPCGKDMMFSPEFDVIREARRHDDASLEQGDWVAEERSRLARGGSL